MRLVFALVLFFNLCSVSWGQYLVSVRAGLIHHAEGQVYLDEAPFEFSADRLHQIEKGQYLRTGTGKVEVQLGPGASLWMDKNACLQMVDPSLTNTLLRIDRGSVFIEVLEKHKNSRIRIQTGTSEIELKKTGLYRLDSGSNRFYVFDGKAEILKNQEKATLKKGRSAVLSSDLKIYKFSRNYTDAFHEWVQKRSFVVYSRIKLARRRELMALQMSGRRLLMEMESFARRQMQQLQQQQWLESLQQRAMQ